jgi:hypothetical protein
MIGSARRRTALAVALVACALPAGSAQAALPRDNVATAFATAGNSRDFEFAWDVHRERGVDVVDDRNSATARSTSCTGCKAAAIAFQIVLVSGSPRVVVPQNTAEAANVECTACDTTAEARQFVRVFPWPVRFTWRGRAILADVRHDLRALRFSDLSPLSLHVAVEQQQARVESVLANELVRRADPSTDADPLAQRTLQSADLQ